MNKFRLFFMILCLLSITSTISAQEKRWVDEAELSFVDTDGNTDLMNLSARNLLKYTFNEKITGSWKLSTLYGKSEGIKNAESYSTDFRVDYLLTENLYAVGIAGWLSDKFAGIKDRYYIGPALGYKFLSGPDQLLEGEAGLNYVMEDYIDNTEKEYAQGRVFGKYEYFFSNKNKFFQSLEFLYDFEESENYNVNSESETALISALSDYLSLKASYKIMYDNQPVPSTLEETDTMLSLTLVAKF